MPKKKRLEEAPNEQFKRFVEVAQKHEIDEKKTGEMFKRLTKSQAMSKVRSTRVRAK